MCPCALATRSLKIHSLIHSFTHPNNIMIIGRIWCFSLWFLQIFFLFSFSSGKSPRAQDLVPDANQLRNEIGRCCYLIVVVLKLLGCESAREESTQQNASKCNVIGTTVTPKLILPIRIRWLPFVSSSSSTSFVILRLWKLSTKRNRNFHVGYTQMPVLYWALDCNERPLQGVVENQLTLFHPQNSSPSEA